MLVRLAGPPLLLVSALDPSSHSRPRRTVSADCALPTYPVFVHAVFAHAALIHTATFTRLLWDCPHIFAAPQDPHTCLHSRHSPSCVLKSARRNDKCANIWTQKARFASISAHGRRFGAHLRTQITFIYATSDGTISIGATWLCNTTHSSEPPPCIWWRPTATALVEGGVLFGFPANRHKTAMASISTRAPLGMSLPPMATRAGLTEPMNTSAYRASTSLKSSTFFM